MEVDSSFDNAFEIGKFKHDQTERLLTSDNQYGVNVSASPRLSQSGKTRPFKIEARDIILRNFMAVEQEKQLLS